jgi:dTDP-4-amino-4,6-dideoxygalactose transaminase
MIPFLDLPAQYRSIKREIDAAVAAVLESGQFILGPEVAAFEQEFADFCGAAHAVGVNSGTSALHLALLAAGVGPGDEVITVPNTFVATIAAIRYTGARPVLVDVDPASCNIDVRRIGPAVTGRTKAILPVHLYGQPADMDPILGVARRHRLLVIEDAAQAHGAAYRGRRVGGIGDLGCFSFYPGKNLGACGEGGIVVTNSPEYAGRIRMLRDWGQRRRYHHELPGYNYRLEGIQGAVLRVKLRRLEAWIDARRARARLYDRLLAERGIGPPEVMPYAGHVYHIYPVRVPHRDRVRQALHDRGVQTAIHYPVPVHLQPAYRDLGYGPGSFPNAEALAREELSLPIYPELSAEAAQRVVSELVECVAEARRAPRGAAEQAAGPRAPGPGL